MNSDTVNEIQGGNESFLDYLEEEKALGIPVKEPDTHALNSTSIIAHTIDPSRSLEDTRQEKEQAIIASSQDEVDRSLVESHKAGLKSSILQVAQNDLGPEDVEGQVLDTLIAVDTVDQEFKTTTSFDVSKSKEAMFVEQVEPDEEPHMFKGLVTAEAIRQQTVDRFSFMGDIAKMVSSNSFKETAGNYAHVLLAPSASVRTDLFVKKYSAVMGGKSVNSFDKVLQHFSSLPREAQLDHWEKIKEIAISSHNNNEEQAAITLFALVENNDLHSEMSVVNDALIALPTGALALSRLYAYNKLARHVNAVNKLSGAEANDAAAAMILAAKEDKTGEVARALGLNEEDIAHITNPLTTPEDVVPTAINNLHNDITAAQLSHAIDVDTSLRKVIDDLTRADGDIELVLQGMPGITGESQEALKARILENLKDHQDVLGEAGQMSMYDVRIADVTNTEMKLSFNLTNEAKSLKAKGGDVTDVTVKLRLDDEVGSWILDDYNRINNYRLSPSKLFSEEGIVTRLTEGNNQASIIYHKLQQAYVKALSPQGKLLNKKSRARLDKVLEHGDDTGRVFTPYELRKEIHTPRGTVRLSEKEVSSYYATRKVIDNLFDLENHVSRRSLTKQGYKEVHITGASTELAEVGGKAYASKAGALQAIARMQKKKVGELHDFERALVQQDDGGIWHAVIPKEVVTKKMVAKPFDTARIARGAMKNEQKLALDGQKIDTFVFNPTLKDGDGSAIRLTQKDINRMYKEGFELVKYKSPQRFAGSRRDVNFAFVAKENVTDLPLVVLQRKRGYVPKRTKPGSTVFLKELNQDGTVGRTVHMYSDYTRAEAGKLAYIKSANKDKKATDPAQDFIVLEDRQLSSDDNLRIMQESYGSLYTSPRKGNIPFDDTGNLLPRVSPIQAIGDNIGHASSGFANIDNVLLMNKRFTNVANEIAATVGKNVSPFTNPRDSLSPLNPLLKNHPKFRSLQRAQKYIKDTLRMPSLYSDVMRDIGGHLARKLENVIYTSEERLAIGAAKVARKSIMAFSHGDPVAFVKTTVFHPLLGMFNPVQMVVQASGAQLAFSMNPLRAPKTLQEILNVRALIGADPLVKGYDDVVKHIARSGGFMDAKELRQLHHDYLKTGLRDSIQGNADMDMLIRQGGMSVGWMKRTLDKGLFFYREGEEFTRMYSFFEARAAWKVKNKGRAVDDKAITEMVTDTYRRMINFQRENRAMWQTGVMSVPTQFWQVPAKYMGNLLGRKSEWTAGERMQVGASQFALWGTAGVPFFGDVLGDQLYRWFGYDDPLEVNDSDKRNLRNGLSNMILDASGLSGMEVSDRLSFAGGIRTGTFVDYALGDTPYYKIPAAYSIYTRAGEAMEAFSPLLRKGVDPDLEVGTEEVFGFFDGLTKIASSTRGPMKAFMLYNLQRYESKRNSVIIDKSEKGGFTVGEVAATALGFTLTEVREHYERKAYNIAAKERISTGVQLYLETINSHFNVVKDLWGKPDKIKDQSEQEARVRFLVKESLDLTDEEFAKVELQVFERLRNGSSQEDFVKQETIKALTDRYEEEVKTPFEMIFGGDHELPRTLPIGINE